MKACLLAFCGVFLFMTTAEAQKVDWREFSHTVGIAIEKAGGTTTCSGILISPTVVLTAAHCVDGFLKARVTTERSLRKQDVKFIEVTRGSMHPGYRGNLPGGSVDVGLLFLKEAIQNEFNPTQIGTLVTDLPFERIGFGGRAGENIRTWILSFYEGEFGDYLRARDELGVLGDSGGPVFQRQKEGLRLIGVHTGREIATSGQLTNISYIQPLTSKVLGWVTSELNK
jgi:V8-like Glu-specific endopeptidase